MECVVCGADLVKASTGRPRSTCGQRCRKRLQRARAKSSFPAVMRESRRWARADGKRPIRVDGSPASSTASWTWDSFDAVQSGPGDGFGVMLGNGLACLDLDHCFDGDHLAGWAQDEIDRTDSVLYVERSVSGRGLHVFYEAPEGPGSRRGNVERYSRARFIRCGTPYV